MSKIDRRSIIFNGQSAINQNSIDREEQEACEQIEDEKDEAAYDYPMIVRQVKVNFGSQTTSQRQSIVDGNKSARARNITDFNSAQQQFRSLERQATELLAIRSNLESPYYKESQAMYLLSDPSQDYKKIQDRDHLPKLDLIKSKMASMTTAMTTTYQSGSP